MDLGIALPILANIDVKDQLQIAIKAEELGFKSVWASDHIVIPKEWKGRFSDIFPDPFIILTAISQNTKKIKIGTSAIILPYRNPIIVAKMCSTLDHFCDGRLTCTVAPGWMKEEFDILNISYDGRIDKTVEYIKVLKSLWEDDPTDFKGNFYSFNDVSFQPKPIQKHLPVWMGGNHEKAIQRSIDYADGWQPIWFSSDELEIKMKYLKQYAEEKERNLDNFSISLRNRIRITQKSDKNSEHPPTALIGEKNEVYDKILSYRRLDIKEVVLDFITPDKEEIIETLEILGNELIPEL
ncbi:TIGR03619 family F420-dependent LLM class oxidoreductase [bacterium]|nr:TIGR03619 family F420-dependent LLM class oxidoreductase [bacterium]